MKADWEYRLWMLGVVVCCAVLSYVYPNFSLVTAFVLGWWFSEEFL